MECGETGPHFVSYALNFDKSLTCSGLQFLISAGIEWAVPVGFKLCFMELSAFHYVPEKGVEGIRSKLTLASPPSHPTFICFREKTSSKNSSAGSSQGLIHNFETFYSQSHDFKWLQRLGRSLY